MGVCFSSRINPIDEEQRSLINDIIKFWFLTEDEWNRQTCGPPSERWSECWFCYVNPDENDANIKEQFGGALEKLISGEYNGWEHDRDGRLAAILCYDQFSRNIHRKSPQAFATDLEGLKICKAIIRSEDPTMNLSAYKYGELMFVLMPLIHNENESDTRLFVDELTKLNDAMEADESITWNLTLNIEKGKIHNNTIEKFGRYPTRNAALGRENTKAEIEFLESADTNGQ